VGDAFSFHVLTMLGKPLGAAISDEFFRWFHWERYESPSKLADGNVWNGFRPQGEKFRALATLNVETDAADHIVDVTLCLDRAFVEHPKDGAFARDVAASFLRWALSENECSVIAGFLDELGDLGPNVIRLGKAAPVPADPSPLYRVFAGRDKECDIDFPDRRLRLINLQARDGPRDPRHDWIWLRLHEK
jgi:hypothetical protein